MFRRLVIFTLVIGFGAEAWADIPPPPPPAGQKYVDVRNEVRLGKEFDDYVFFIAEGQGPGPPRYHYSKVTLSTKSSTTMPAGGRYRYIELLAVPKASADQVNTDGPLVPGGASSGDLKIAGLCRLGFGDTATITSKHPGGSVKRTYTITGFDKDGRIQTTVEREPVEAEGEKKSNSRAEAGPGKTQSVVAGIALALSLAVGGLLLVRKQRERVAAARD